ncbi:hypothetical protein F5Y12DRAFT_484712 [Xylaria sp. FL1777]|nr:hypothetical protein F5Y12DRAFT_484712 [Xylaria sp. FL1777]
MYLGHLTIPTQYMTFCRPSRTSAEPGVWMYVCVGGVCGRVGGGQERKRERLDWNGLEKEERRPETWKLGRTKALGLAREPIGAHPGIWTGVSFTTLLLHYLPSHPTATLPYPTYIRIYSVHLVEREYIYIYIYIYIYSSIHGCCMAGRLILVGIGRLGDFWRGTGE